jgi:large subunit GTPase 1
MTAEEVDRHEKDSFLEWRRHIASLESVNANKKVTPFEKNLEVWRQLWRVLERSDLVCQIVDARNPLLY